MLSAKRRMRPYIPGLYYHDNHLYEPKAGPCGALDETLTFLEFSPSVSGGLSGQINQVG